MIRKTGQGQSADTCPVIAASRAPGHEPGGSADDDVHGCRRFEDQGVDDGVAEDVARVSHMVRSLMKAWSNHSKAAQDQGGQGDRFPGICRRRQVAASGCAPFGRRPCFRPGRLSAAAENATRRFRWDATKAQRAESLERPGTCRSWRVNTMRLLTRGLHYRWEKALRRWPSGVMEESGQGGGMGSPGVISRSRQIFKQASRSVRTSFGRDLRSQRKNQVALGVDDVEPRPVALQAKRGRRIPRIGATRSGLPLEGGAAAVIGSIRSVSRRQATRRHLSGHRMAHICRTMAQAGPQRRRRQATPFSSGVLPPRAHHRCLEAGGRAAPGTGAFRLPIARPGCQPRNTGRPMAKGSRDRGRPPGPGGRPIGRAWATRVHGRRSRNHAQMPMLLAAKPNHCQA